MGSRQEMQTFAARTPKSLAALERARRSLPLGVTSNFRFYPPHPISIARAQGTRVWDLDGNEYLDTNMAFGALMTGHAHPVVLRAVREQLDRGTMYAMPHEREALVAEELCRRFGLDRIRFANTGTEATMHAIRVARGFTRRDKVVKMEGAYHGVHDTVLISYKPDPEAAGNPKSPRPVKGSMGVPDNALENTVPATFNDLDMLRKIFERDPSKIAAVIIEPIMMNIGVAMPEPGYLEGLRSLCSSFGALLIFDEVKTGVKLAAGGACEYFKVRPDLITLAKSIGGGFPLAAFGGRADVMAVMERGEVFHAGTYNANPLVLAASHATLTEVLTPDAYKHTAKLNRALVDGYHDIIRREGLVAYAIGAGPNGTVHFTDRKVRNYRDWLTVDAESWKTWWYAMLNRGFIPQAYAWDEQWTISVQHTEADIERHLNAFREVAPLVAQVQERSAQKMVRQGAD